MVKNLHPHTPSLRFHALRARWRDYWFAPLAPDRLCLCRLIYFALLFCFYLNADFRGWYDVAGFFWRPHGFYHLLALQPLPDPATFWVQSLWKAALLLSCLGLFTRLSTATAFGLGFYLLGLPAASGKTSHATVLVVFVLLILALSRCGDAWSLDHWIRRWRTRRRAARAEARTADDAVTSTPANPAPPSGEYRWPIRVIWVLMALVFFIPGLQKAHAAGFAWLSNQSFSVLMLHHYYTNEPATSLALELTRVPWLPSAFAVATMMTELGFPLALISRRARWVLVTSAFCMQVGIAVLFDVWFTQFMFAYIFWAPVATLMHRRAPHSPPHPPLSHSPA